VLNLFKINDAYENKIKNSFTAGDEYDLTKSWQSISAFLKVFNM